MIRGNKEMDERSIGEQFNQNSAKKKRASV
jgi:hypothetical protein